MMARPVADLSGAITQLLLPFIVSAGGSISARLENGNGRSTGLERLGRQADLLGGEREDVKEIVWQARIEVLRQMRFPCGLQAEADYRWPSGSAGDSRSRDFARRGCASNRGCECARHRRRSSSPASIRAAEFARDALGMARQPVDIGVDTGCEIPAIRRAAGP